MQSSELGCGNHLFVSIDSLFSMQKKSSLKWLYFGKEINLVIPSTWTIRPEDGEEFSYNQKITQYSAINNSTTKSICMGKLVLRNDYHLLFFFLNKTKPQGSQIRNLSRVVIGAKYTFFCKSKQAQKENGNQMFEKRKSWD